MRKQLALKDVTLFWACLRHKNDMSGKYQVDLCNLNSNQKEALEDAGITVRNKGDDRGDFVTAKSAKYEIIAKDDSGAELPLDVQVGNGSKANVVVETYEWSHAATKRSGVGLGIKIGGLVVTDLNQYRPAGEVSFEDLEEAL
jgi:hypothetical protein